jgi:hypothetical protein
LRLIEGHEELEELGLSKKFHRKKLLKAIQDEL